MYFPSKRKISTAKSESCGGKGNTPLLFYNELISKSKKLVLYHYHSSFSEFEGFLEPNSPRGMFLLPFLHGMNVPWNLILVMNFLKSEETLCNLKILDFFSHRLHSEVQGNLGSKSFSFEIFLKILRDIRNFIADE
jgi:hypothetical protein